jgi:hypothetical protein
MSLAQVDGIATIERQDEKYRRAWLLEHLSVYVRLIRGVVADKLSYDFSDLGNDPLGGRHQRQITALRGKMPAGRYFSKFFYSRDSEFLIPASRMESSHPHEKFEDKIIVTSNGKNSTLAFGPYIRIPPGLWQIEATVSASMIGEEDITLALSVFKGVPGLRLERQVQIGRTLASRSELTFCVVFENPSDTGALEFILSSAVLLSEECRIELSAPRLKKLDCAT